MDSSKPTEDKKEAPVEAPAQAPAQPPAEGEPKAPADAPATSPAKTPAEGETKPAAEEAPKDDAKDETLASTKSAAELKATWEELRKEIPRDKTPEEKQRRVELFKKFDKKGNGSLTLDEVREGCVDILHLNEFTVRVKDITKRAFNKAKDMGNKERGEGSDETVEFLEFRLMLCYIYDYFELTVMFDSIDTSRDMFVDKQEFKDAVPKINEWGLKIEDPDKTFDEMHENKNRRLTFDEFAAWATEKKLEVEGDPDLSYLPSASVDARDIERDAAEEAAEAEAKAPAEGEAKAPAVGEAKAPAEAPAKSPAKTPAEGESKSAAE